MGFWTRVRLPSAPLESKRSNTVPISKIAVFGSAFGIVLDTSKYGIEQNDSIKYPLTFSTIQQWIEDKYHFKVSKSSISMVKAKCNVSTIDFKAGKEPDTDIIKSESEKLVLEAFRVFGVV